MYWFGKSNQPHARTTMRERSTESVKQTDGTVIFDPPRMCVSFSHSAMLPSVRSRTERGTHRI